MESYTFAPSLNSRTCKKTALFFLLYNGQPHDLNTKFIRLGFIYQFHIAVENNTLIFERDEEGKYRVIDANPHGSKADKVFL